MCYVVNQVEHLVGVLGPSGTAIHECEYLEHEENSPGVTDLDSVTEFTYQQDPGCSPKRMSGIFRNFAFRALRF